MQHQQGRPQTPELFLNLLRRKIDEKLPAELELPAGQIDLRFPLAFDLLQAIGKQVADMFRIKGSSNRGNRPNLWQKSGSLQHRRAAEGMAD